MYKEKIRRIIGTPKKIINNYRVQRQFRVDFAAYKDELKKTSSIYQLSNPKAAAVLLSYQRPKNLPWITLSLLKNEFVSRVIVSNNNPEIRMEDWFDFSDPRLEIINQKKRRRAGYRFEIAKYMEEEYFIFIDDDLFLTPSQTTTLFKELLNNPSVPHGVWGQRFFKSGDRFSWKDGVRNYNGELDVINRSYFLTRSHINKFITLLRELGINRIVDLKFGDDMILSFSGEKRPICHDVGTLLNCPSKDSEGIAIWKENEFFSYRSEMYEKLLPLRKARMQKF